MNGVESKDLLGFDSELGKFLDNPKASEIFTNTDIKEQFETKGKLDKTKYNLDLIEKYYDVEKESKKARKYDRLSKVEWAITIMSGIVGFVVLSVIVGFAIKSNNKDIKKDLEKLSSRFVNKISEEKIKLSAIKGNVEDHKLVNNVDKVKEKLVPFCQQGQGATNSKPPPHSTSKQINSNKSQGRA